MPYAASGRSICVVRESCGLARVNPPRERLSDRRTTHLPRGAVRDRSGGPGADRCSGGRDDSAWERATPQAEAGSPPLYVGGVHGARNGRPPCLERAESWPRPHAPGVPWSPWQVRPDGPNRVRWRQRRLIAIELVAAWPRHALNERRSSLGSARKASHRIAASWDRFFDSVPRCEPSTFSVVSVSNPRIRQALRRLRPGKTGSTYAFLVVVV